MTTQSKSPRGTAVTLLAEGGLDYLLFALVVTLSVWVLASCSHTVDYRDENGRALKEKSGHFVDIVPPKSLSEERDEGFSFGEPDLETLHSEVPNYHMQLLPVTDSPTRDVKKTTRPDKKD